MAVVPRGRDQDGAASGRGCYYGAACIECDGGGADWGSSRVYHGTTLGAQPCSVCGRCVRGVSLRSTVTAGGHQSRFI